MLAVPDVKVNAIADGGKGFYEASHVEEANRFTVTCSVWGR